MSKENIGKILRYYRERKKIDVKQVAEKFNKSIKTVYSWENGLGQPDADTLIELCLLYGIDSLNTLQSEVSTELVKEKVMEQSNLENQNEEKIFNYFNKLNEIGREILLEQARMMSNNPIYKK